MIKVELLPDGRSFVNGDGDVRFICDLLEDMEPIKWPSPTVDPGVTAVIGLQKQTSQHRRPRRGTEPISGRDLGRLIDKAQATAKKDLGRELTLKEYEDIARQVERDARGV